MTLSSLLPRWAPAWPVLAVGALLAAGPAQARTVGNAPTGVRRDLWGIDPGSFGSTRSLIVLGLAGVAAAWTWEETDENFAPLQKALDGSRLDPLLDIGNVYGSGWVVGGGSAALLGLGEAIGNDGMTATGADLARSFLYTSGVTWIVKAAVGRRRPTGGPYSFPSGHTAAAFSTVVPIWHHGGWMAGTAAGTMATLAGIARLEENRHFISDVVAGTVLGLVVGWAVIDHRRGAGLFEHLVLTGNTAALQWRF